jgi:hypothetical protein
MKRVEEAAAQREAEALQRQAEVDRLRLEELEIAKKAFQKNLAQRLDTDEGDAVTDVMVRCPEVAQRLGGIYQITKRFHDNGATATKVPGRESIAASKTLAGPFSAMESDYRSKPVLMSVGNLSARERMMVKFGDTIIDELNMREWVGKLSIASALPAPNSAVARRNRFASAYYFAAADKAHGTSPELMVHVRRLRHVGEFTVVLIHAIAHIQSGDMTNDAARSFGKNFFSLCSHVATACFAPEEASAVQENRSLSEMFGGFDSFAASKGLMSKIADAEAPSDDDEDVDSTDL